MHQSDDKNQLLKTVIEMLVKSKILPFWNYSGQSGDPIFDFWVDKAVNIGQQFFHFWQTIAMMNFGDNGNRFPEKWRSKLFDAHSDLGYPNSDFTFLNFFGVELKYFF